MSDLITREEALSHFGVKGMHWGVRKDRPSGGSQSEGNQSPPTLTTESAAQIKSRTRKDTAKKVAIGLGVLAVVAGTGYATYALNKNGKLPLSSMKSSARVSSVKKGSEFARDVIKEPTDVIHLARGKHVGLTFLKKGGTEDYFKVFDKLGLNTNQTPEFFERAADGSGKVAARIRDELGRRDFAGRPIGHDIVVPKHMAEGLSSVADVKEKIWPFLKDQYDSFYEESLIDKKLIPRD